MNKLLIGIIIVLLVYLFFVRQENAQLSAKNATLEEHLKAKVEVNCKDNTVTYVSAKVDAQSVTTGKPNATQTTVYVPSEGNVQVGVIKDDAQAPKPSIIEHLTTTTITDTDNNVQIKVTKAGFTFNPALSVSFGERENTSDKFIGQLQARLIYWNRFGAGAGVDLDGEVYPFVDYKLDKLIPKARNVTVGAQYNFKTETPKLQLAIYMF